MLNRPCLPQVIRDFRIETICESAVSPSLKEMALADMGIAWLAGDIVRQELVRQELVKQELVKHELADQRLISCARERGEIELGIILYYRDEGLVKQVGEVIAAMERLS
jgi:DNA-binding transcriptional LysR family regulator